jgi:uncharacterized metal-binding protein YceD (DUF177 family)
MSKPDQKGSTQPWRVPVAVQDVPEAGRRFELAADEGTRAAIAKMAGINGVSRLEAVFDVTRHKLGGLRIHGNVSATVRQDCVVTLEPIENEIEEEVDLVFAPDAAADSSEVEVSDDDAPEPLIGGSVDLGVIATEFLILAIDPYPRKPGVVFERPGPAEVSANPFAALAALKKAREQNED